MNIFESASKNKFRFSSDRGELTTEQLWDLKLDTLDTIAKNVNRQLKEVTEESFVSINVNPSHSALTIKLEVVKYIIASKLEELKATKEKQANAKKREQLLEILDRKENEALHNMSKEEIIAQLASL
jgi:hypothetical protein